jgi:SAM-dependent methyltransferase
VFLFDFLCRMYQRLFRVNYPEAEELARLHAAGDSSAFLRSYFDHEYRKGGRMVDRFLAISHRWTGGRTLDFGCGVGGLSFRLAEHCSHVTGIDIDAGHIAFARAQLERLGVGNLDFLHYDGGDVPLEAGSFDVVFCVDVVEHLPNPERFIADFHRLLKPGGWFLLSFGPPWYHAHGKHMWEKVPGWWSHLLFPRSSVMKAAGYPPTKTWGELGIQRLGIGRMEGILARSPFRALHQDVNMKRVVSPLKRVPLLRELFIAEMVGVYRKPE